MKLYVLPITSAMDKSTAKVQVRLTTEKWTTKTAIAVGSDVITHETQSPLKAIDRRRLRSAPELFIAGFLSSFRIRKYRTVDAATFGKYIMRLPKERKSWIDGCH